MHRALVLALCFVTALLAVGCQHVSPWQRTKLAHPTMTTVGVPGAAEDHMYSVHEGATGGSATPESGCGCN